MRLARPAILASLLLLGASACGDDGPGVTDPVTATGARFSVRYSGDGRSGSIEASAAPEIDGTTVEARSFVVGLIDTGGLAGADADSSLIVIGTQVDGQRADGVFLYVQDRTRGSYSFGAGCLAPGTLDVGGCAMGFLVLDARATDEFGDSGSLYVLGEGTLTLSGLTDESVRGSFSGTAYPTDGNDQVDTSHPVKITSGSFTAPLWDAADLPSDPIVNLHVAPAEAARLLRRPPSTR